MKRCDIIMPVWDELDSTRECAEKLKGYTHYPYRLIVVDNGSMGPARDYLKGLKNIFTDFVLIRNEENLGFVKAVNQGFAASASPYICLLNNDAYVTDGWLDMLVETVECGPREIGMANPTSNVFGVNGPDGAVGEWQELDSCRGFCMLIKKEVLDRVGPFDEIYGMGYFEEKDYSRRAIAAGYICIRAKAPFVYHRDALSFDKIKNRHDIFRKNEAIYNNRWGRSLNIALVAEKEEELAESKDAVHRLLDKGHHVYIFFVKTAKAAAFKDHINIRYFPTGRLFFEYVVLFKLRERLRKKKIEIVIAGNSVAKAFLDRFRSIHKADVVDRSDHAGLAALIKRKVFEYYGEVPVRCDACL